MEAALRAALAQENTLPWAWELRLAWSDFHGAPDATSHFAAVTWSGIRYQLQCTGDTLTYAVLAVFDPARSWAKPELVRRPYASTLILQHEQVHFDIAELLARRLRQAFAEAGSVCSSPDPQGAASALYEPLARELEALHDQYDHDTRHGQIENRQVTWEDRITMQLQSLAAFQAPASERVP